MILNHKVDIIQNTKGESYQQRGKYKCLLVSIITYIGFSIWLKAKHEYKYLQNT